MTGSFVSVVVPAYNAARYLAEALDSALQQDYDAKEIIVVDDGSTDETPEIVKRYSGRVVSVRQENRGSAAARNVGVAHARGDYLAFLDSDDLWLQGKLRAQVGYLDRHSNVGLVYSSWDVWHPGSSGQFELPQLDDPLQHEEDALDHAFSGWIYNDLLLDCFIQTSTVMMRRSVAGQVGEFQTRFRRGQDYDYWLRTSQVTEIHKLARVWSLYRIHNESITRRVHPVNYGYDVLRNAIDRFGGTSPGGRSTPDHVIARRLAGVSVEFAYQHLLYGDPRIARASFTQSIRYAPLRPKIWLLWALAGLRSLYQ